MLPHRSAVARRSPGLRAARRGGSRASLTRSTFEPGVIRHAGHDDVVDLAIVTADVTGLDTVYADRVRQVIEAETGIA